MSLDEMDRMSEIEDKVELINTNVVQLLGAIRGNQLTQDGGLVKDIQNLDHKIDKIEDNINRRIVIIENRLSPLEKALQKINWTMVVVLAIASFIGGALSLFFQYLSLKK